MRRYLPFLLVAFVAILSVGCGDDLLTTPTPSPVPPGKSSQDNDINQGVDIVIVICGGKQVLMPSAVAADLKAAGVCSDPEPSPSPSPSPEE